MPDARQVNLCAHVAPAKKGRQDGIQSSNFAVEVAMGSIERGDVSVQKRNAG
jgi:hypothetical protein